MPRTTKPIHKTSSGRWQARTRDATGQRISQTFDTSREANDWYAETRTAVRHGTYVDPGAGRQRFADFAARWGDAQDWKQSTRESFAPHLRRVSEHLGDAELGRIDKLALERTRKGLLDAGYARSTTTISLHYAAAIMRAAYQSGLIPRDPTIGLKPPRRRTGDRDGRVNPENVPTRDEVLAILAAAPSRYRAAVALGVAGLRVSEMLGVTADRLDLSAPATLLVDRQLQYLQSRMQFTGPKREKVRTIELPSVTELELRRHLREHQGGGLLFRGLRGAEMLRRDQFYASAWRAALRGAGLDEDRFKFHSLRHFCASSMLADGAPITAVAGHLGDTVETISKVYLHWLRDDRSIPRMVLDRLLASRADAQG